MHSMFGGNAYQVAMVRHLSFTYFYFFWFCNATFFHSGYVIKPSQPSSAIYGALPFTGNPNFAKTDWVVFDLSLLLYYYHSVAFALMSNITMSIYSGSATASPILVKLVSIPIFSRMDFLNMQY